MSERRITLNLALGAVDLLIGDAEHVEDRFLLEFDAAQLQLQKPVHSAMPCSLYLGARTLARAASPSSPIALKLSFNSSSCGV
eukprot:5890456-Prymnesium_polylepis.1